VANAVAGTVSVLSLTTPISLTATIPVGTEPQALVLNFAGTRLFVGNAGSDSISVIDTTSDAVTSTIAIPETAGHGPRALAIAPTGAGERLLAAMFFAELRPGHNGLDEGQDDSREGRVAVFDAGSLALLSTVALAPQADTGFLSNGSVLDH